MDYSIVILNLDRRPDRMSNTIEEMNKFSNIYQRYSAIDTGTPHGIFQSVDNILDETDKDQVLIIQDDILLFNYSKKIWDENICDVPNDWDIILGGCHRPLIKEHINKNIIKVNHFTGLQMALFKKSNKYKFKDYKGDTPFDHYLGELAHHNKLNIYCIVPYCSIQRDGFSDLRKKDCSDYQIFKKGEERLLNECRRLYKCDYDEHLN